MKSPFKYSPDIMILGTKKDVERAKRSLKNISLLKNLDQPKARLEIQKAIDEQRLRASILYRGNIVWSRNRILRNLKRIKEKGKLYDNGTVEWVESSGGLRLPAKPNRFRPVLSEYFYTFLHMCCGSQEHYSRAGWIGAYRTVEDLKRFFQKNEYGKPVTDWIPAWKADALRIAEEVERILMPFRSYAKSKDHHT